MNKKEMLNMLGSNNTKVDHEKLNRKAAITAANSIQLPEYRKTDDIERFMVGFKELCAKCNIHIINYYTMKAYDHKIPIITAIKADDGSEIGIVPLLNYCGFGIEHY